MRVSFCVFSLVCSLLLNATDGEKVVLLDGQRFRFKGAVEEELYMLSFQTSTGKVLLSKALIDWQETWLTAPDLVAQYRPEAAKQAQARFSRLRKPPKEAIVIDNKALKGLKPGQGMAKKWESDLANKPVSGSRTKTAVVPKRPVVPVIKTISSGDQVTLSAHLEKGKYVIFDFYADWCGPCRQADPHIKKVVRNFPANVALKKINIVNWSSPVARQYGINSIPHLRLYGPNGKKVMQGSPSKVLGYLERKGKKQGW